MQQQKWCALREIIDELATSLDDYTTYLLQQSRIVKQKQDSLRVSDSETPKVLPINASVNGRIQPLYSVRPGEGITHTISFVHLQLQFQLSLPVENSRGCYD